MKLFNRKQKEESTDSHPEVVVIGNGSRGLPDPEKDDYKAAATYNYAANMKVLRERTLEQERILEQEYDNSRKSVGGWIKTLQCSSIKNKDPRTVDDLYLGVKSARTSKRHISWQNDLIDTPRPVVITVKENDAAQQRQRPPSLANIKSDGSGGQHITKPSSRFKVFRRGDPFLARPSVSRVNRNELKYARDMEDLMTYEEIARRLRWQKYMENKNWKDDGDFPSLFGHLDEESIRNGCHSTCTDVNSYTTDTRTVYSNASAPSTVYTSDYTYNDRFPTPCHNVGGGGVAGAVSAISGGGGGGGYRSGSGGGYTTEETDATEEEEEEYSDESEDTPYRNRRLPPHHHHHRHGHRQQKHKQKQQHQQQQQNERQQPKQQRQPSTPSSLRRRNSRISHNSRTSRSSRSSIRAAPSISEDEPISYDDEPIRNSPKRKIKRNESLSSKSGRDDSLYSGFSEDFRIIATLLMQDGAACLGCAADITRESISSCRGEEFDNVAE